MMQTARNLDDNGFLLVKGCPLSSFGIFDYSAGQVGLPGDPNRIVKVFRPESAVSEPDAVNSFKNVPFIDEHAMLHGIDEQEGLAPEEKGVDGVLTSNVYYDAPWMRGDLKVFSRKLQSALSKGKSDLSLGYGCQFEHKPGIWNGQPYEVVQTKLRGNHIALVGEGRVPGARVLDGLVFDHLSFESVKPNEELDMHPAKKKIGDNAVQQLQALIPALQKFLSEEATEPAHQEGETQTEVPVPDVATEGENKTGEIPAGEEPSAEPSPDPATAAPSEVSADPSSEPEQAPAEGGDLQSMISQIKTVLAQLEAAVPGGNTADEGMTNEPVADTVEGLQESSHPGAQVCADEDTTTTAAPKASPGPSAGTHSSASDAALRNFYADVGLKTGIYDRLSKVVGAFDHSAMDSAQVISYGVKTLKLKVGDSKALDVLTAHLDGIDSANEKARLSLLKKHAGDSLSEAPEIEAYLKGN